MAAVVRVNLKQLVLSLESLCLEKGKAFKNISLHPYCHLCRLFAASLGRTTEAAQLASPCTDMPLTSTSMTIA